MDGLAKFPDKACNSLSSVLVGALFGKKESLEEMEKHKILRKKLQNSDGRSRSRDKARRVKFLPQKKVRTRLEEFSLTFG